MIRGSWKNGKKSPGLWLGGLECCPVHRKVAGWVPGWGAYGKQPIDISRSHQCFSLSLSKSINIFLSEDFKKKNGEKSRDKYVG